MKIITKLVLYIFAFILIYYINLFPTINPYIFPIIWFSLLFFMEVFSGKINTCRDVFLKKVSRKFIFGIILSAIYCALIYLIKNEDISLDGTRIIQNLMFLIYFGIVSIFVKYLGLFYDTNEKKMAFIFRVACIQGLICLAMLIFPQLKAIANNIFISGSRFVEGDYILTSRVYGISNSYTYGLPILHGLLSGVCFYYGSVRNKKYFWYLPLILTVALLNGRTGTIIAFLTIGMSLVYLLIKSKYKMRIILILIGILVLMIIILAILERITPIAYSFLSSAFGEIKEFFFQGELSGTSKYLLQDRLIFPEGIDLLFGSGYRLYALRELGMKSSDIGFVNDLFIGGIIYCAILYYSYYCLVNSSFIEKDLKFLKVIIIVTLLIANWKGEIFKNATFIIGLFFIVIINLFTDDTLSIKRKKIE